MLLNVLVKHVLVMNIILLIFYSASKQIIIIQNVVTCEPGIYLLLSCNLEILLLATKATHEECPSIRTFINLFIHLLASKLVKYHLVTFAHLWALAAYLSVSAARAYLVKK